MSWIGYVARRGQRRDVYRFLVLKLGNPRRKWVNNIKMEVEEYGIGACTGLIWPQNRDRRGLL
jgi:hypothetical protein